MFIPAHGDFTDVLIALVSALGGWFVKRICWVKQVDTKMAVFATDIEWIKQAITGLSMQLQALVKK